tara:strand:+ start:1327 stop:2046 length:720 start_codon:yes stop_codon:yes gene_type:complete
MNITLYIGYDSSNYGQELAYKVCERSVLKYNKNIKIVPLIKKELEERSIFNREDNTGSTEFTYTRFLVPYLNNYQGIALFCDSDFLWRYDILDILKYYDKTYAVSCVQHEYNKCCNNLKMDGLKQEWYPRKNWSSLMLFNCEHNDCKNLSICNINTKSPKWLHRMEWTTDIGQIPKTYNYLIGYYADIKEPNAVHFTDGGPWHSDWYQNNIPVDNKFGNEWINYLHERDKSYLFNLTLI